jgi:serine/threonine protein kinase
VTIVTNTVCEIHQANCPVVPRHNSIRIQSRVTHGYDLLGKTLKPANIKVTADGTVKVLDFGLAKALSDGPTEENISNSPTLSMAATRQGVILGTAAYMSSEQAKGKTVDRRADSQIWVCGQPSPLPLGLRSASHEPEWWRRRRFDGGQRRP